MRWLWAHKGIDWLKLSRHELTSVQVLKHIACSSFFYKESLRQGFICKSAYAFTLLQWCYNDVCSSTQYEKQPFTWKNLVMKLRISAGFYYMCSLIILSMTEICFSLEKKRKISNYFYGSLFSNCVPKSKPYFSTMTVQW